MSSNYNRPADSPPPDEPSPKRVRSEALELVDDWLDSAASDQLDSSFSNTMLSWPKRSTAFADPDLGDRHYAMATFLLEVVNTVNRDHACMKQELDNPSGASTFLRTLLEDMPNIEEVFVGAAKLKSIKPIRLLKVFHDSSASPGTRRKSPILSDPSQWGAAVRAAWKRPYQGTHALLLLNNINNMNRDKPYSNSVSIVQGSGSGKSRMVQEQASLVFTLPFNLRPIADDKDLAYPPPDNSVREYLIRRYNCFQCAKNCFLLFFKAIFEKALAELSFAVDDVPRDLAQWWAIHLEQISGGPTKRTELFEAAVADCQSESRLHACSHNRTEHTENVTPEDIAVRDSALEALESLVQQIVELSSSNIGLNKVKVMTYFDEAHSLIGSETKPKAYIEDDVKSRDLYDVLLSVFDDLREQHIFAIFLSTVSSLTARAPPGPLARSARRQHATALQAPITETPFDCSPTFPLKPETLRLEDLSTVRFMAQFGRPLFWTMIEGAQDPRSVHSTIIPLARAKLLRSNSIYDSQSPSVTDTAATALLDIVLHVSFDPRRDAAQVRQVDMVASHMRTVFSVPQHRAYFRSGYPSEPILAEAAMQQIHQVKDKETPEINWLLRAANKNLVDGILDKGQCGELVARMLLILAYMKQISDEHETPSSHSPLLFSRGCNFVGWVRQLFVADLAEKILDSKPDDDAQGRTLREVYGKATVRITHWLRMGDDTGPKRASFLAAFIRGAGLIFWSSQHTADLGIPFLLDPTRPITEDNIGVLLVQVKNRAKPGAEAACAIDERVLGVYPSGTSGQAYLTWVMELGIQPTLQAGSLAITKPLVIGSNYLTDLTLDDAASDVTDTPSTVNLASPSRAKVPQPPQRPRHHTGKANHRFSAFIYGCSNTNYKVIASAEREVYNVILNNRDLLLEHPRHDADSLRAIRRMKPFWTEGEDCYGSWLQMGMSI